MRSESEMLDLLRNFTDENERIRAVMMDGPRVNSKAPRDIFQDYDVVFLVASVRPFVQDQRWISTFGELVIMKTPDDMVIPSSSNGGLAFHFLMLFKDGNRIDLTLHPVSRIDDLQPKSLSRVLLDKDGIVRQFEPPSYRDDLMQPPTSKHYADPYGTCSIRWYGGT